MVEALAPQLSGIGRYSWELSKRLPANPEIEAVRYRVPGRWVEDPSILTEGQHLPKLPWLLRKTPRPLRNWRDRQELAGSIVHGPNYFLPAEVQSGIITIHDLSVFAYPETHPPARIVQFERDFVSSLKRALHIITDTETMKAEVMAYTGMPADKITSVPLGVSGTYRPRSEEELRGFLSRNDLTKGYGLCISTLEPRKKIDRLIHAWSQLPRALQSQHPLVLAGPKGWLNDDLHEQIERATEQGWLRFLDFVSERDLPALYAGAGLFVYPSIYEGFGLPPVEAMASGVPTIVANRSCLPEVCGDAVLYIDPDDETIFLEALLRGLTDHPWRRSASELGLERAALYSWGRCANETVDVYRKV